MLRLVLLLAASHSLFAQVFAITSKDDWDDVLFAQGSSTLAMGFPSLLRLAGLLHDNPEYRVRIEGHTGKLEARGPAAGKLARARAEAVSAFLLKYGASPTQVEVNGVGDASPVAPDTTPEGLFANRRVSIIVLDANGKAISPSVPQSILPMASPQNPAVDEILKRLDKLDDITRMQQELAERQDRVNRELNEIAARLTPARAAAGAEPPDDLHIRQVGRALLLSGQTEPVGYGLYSYILFPSAPANDEQRKRYIQVLEAYLRLSDIQGIEAALKLEGQVDPKQLHRSMVPVTAAPRAMTPDGILEVYDYIRAGLLLENLAVKQSAALRVRGGPYLACALQALSSGKPKQRLVQTLDWVPPGDLVNAWFQFFLTKSASPRDWDKKTLYQVALEAQSYLENLGAKVPQVREAVIASIFWFSGNSGKTPAK